MFINIKVGSITSAQRAAAALRESGINAVIKKLENPQAGDGCGYVISINKGSIHKAQNVLRRSKIKVLGVDDDDIS